MFFISPFFSFCTFVEGAAGSVDVIVDVTDVVAAEDVTSANTALVLKVAGNEVGSKWDSGCEVTLTMKDFAAGPSSDLASGWPVETVDEDNAEPDDCWVVVAEGTGPSWVSVS